MWLQQAQATIYAIALEDIRQGNKRNGWKWCLVATHHWDMVINATATWPPRKCRSVRTDCKRTALQFIQRPPLTINV
jgi:hypothetical protein